MDGSNTYKGRFIADFRREACQSTAATMLENGFHGTFDEAFECAHVTDQLQAQALIPDPEPIPTDTSNMPAAAAVGLGLLATRPAILDTKETPLDKFWDTAVALDNVLTYGSDADRTSRAMSASRIIRGLIDNAGTEQHRKIIQSVLGVDISEAAAEQLREKYRLDANAVWPLSIPSDTPLE